MINTQALAIFLQEASTRAVTIAAIKVQNEARRLCPVNTGTLRRSIAFSIQNTGGGYPTARVGSNVSYALLVEQGTGLFGPHHSPIVPVNAKVLAFPVKGRIVFARSVKGRKATPFLRPALRAIIH